MENQKLILFLPALLLLLSDSNITRSHGWLLPIVDGDVGDNAGQIKTYIVHVRKPNDTKFVGDHDLEEWHRSFLPNTTLDSGEPQLVYSYRYAISGFAARLTHKEVSAMKAIDGFLRAEPDRRLALQTTYTPTFLGLKQGRNLWSRTNYGEGIIIGVIDSGVLPSHPSFKDDGVPPLPATTKWRGRCDFNASECNNKLIGAKTFLSGRNLPPIDNDGHGTHVASIAAGNFVDDAEVLGNARGTAAGIAPRAHLAIYKACSMDYCDTSDSLKAVDEAIHDGVDVISISLGYEDQQLYEDSFSIGAFAAMEAGIVVCAAAGNRGPVKSMVENDAPWILTVGASSTDRRITSTVRLGNGMEFDGESGYQPAAFNSSTMLPAVHGGYCEKDELDRKDVAGKVVVCWVGRSQIIAKSKAVNESGGAAMIVLNQPSKNTTLADVILVPGSNVNQHDAREISDYIGALSNPNPNATIIFKGTQFGFRPSPTVTFFSSRGPSLVNGGIPKPDIVGPGLNIVGAWPTPVGPDPTSSTTTTTSTFNFLSGTSMATPHLAGVAALLKKSHPNWSPAAIKSAIMTTANKLDLDRNPITDDYIVGDDNNNNASIFAMGAGHVNPLAANHPGLVYDLERDDYIRYLCGLQGYTDDDVYEIVRQSIQCSSFGNISAQQLNYPSILVSLGSASPSVSVSLGSKSRKIIITRTVTNVGEHNSTYSVQIDKPRGVKVNVKPKKLQFKSSNEKKSFNVTFKIKGTPISKELVAQGQLSWVSDKRVVRSPIVVTFT